MNGPERHLVACGVADANLLTSLVAAVDHDLPGGVGLAFRKAETHLLHCSVHANQRGIIRLLLAP